MDAPVGRLAVLPTVVIDASEVSTFIVQLVCSLLFVRVVLLFALLFSCSFPLLSAFTHRVKLNVNVKKYL